MPLLSVCIPTWNAARHLAETLQSLLAQDARELEIVVCDDASGDHTLDVAHRFAGPRLRIVAHTQRLGLAGNWNRALREAHGDLLCLFGQDDVAGPDWARTLCGLLERHPEADLAFGRRNFRFEDGPSRRKLGEFFEHKYPAILAPFYARIEESVPPPVMREEAMRHLFEINLIGEPSFVVVRRAHPAVAAGFDPTLGQLIDWEFYTRFFRDRAVAQSAAVVGTYRLHAHGASAANTPLSTHYREYDRLLQVVLERFADVLQPKERGALSGRRQEVQELRREWERREREGQP